MNTLDYYTLENCSRIFNAIENPRWRTWKTIDEDGKARNRYSIFGPQHLYEFIHQCKNPQALYVSVSTFLNPSRQHGFFANQKITAKEGYYFYPRAGWIISDCILLDSYFFIDLDSEDNLRLAQDDARKIINKFKSIDTLKLHKITFSAKKGIHLVYKMDFKKNTDPIQRIIECKMAKSNLVKILKAMNLNTFNPIHEEIYKDVFRVYAAPYSIKGNGNVVTEITEGQLMNEDIYSTLSMTAPKQVKILKPLAREEETPMTKQGSILEGNCPSSQQYQSGQRAGIISRIILFKFIDNMVTGLKDNYITVLKFKNTAPILKILKKLQKQYRLSDFAVYKIGEYTYAYNTKLVSYRRLFKILKAARSENFRWFIGRKHIPIQISDTFNQDKQIQNKLEKIGILESEYGKTSMHSRFHSELMGLDYDNMTGRNNRIGIMKIEESA